MRVLCLIFLEATCWYHVLLRVPALEGDQGGPIPRLPGGKKKTTRIGKVAGQPYSPGLFINYFASKPGAAARIIGEVIRNNGLY